MSIENEAGPANDGDTGMVCWITGLSGTGKTTVAELLRDHLGARGVPVVLLDGDIMREAIGDGLGHSPDDRRRLALRYARLCRMLAGQGLTVICATVSLFHEVQDWNREHLPGYIEIYLRAPIDELARRDPKGIYANALSGKLDNVVGIDIAAEEPRQPDAVIDNHSSVTPAMALAQILSAMADAGDNR